MTTKQFIEKAIKGGWKVKEKEVVFSDEIEFEFTEHILLDPKAWQAVGKVEGWEDKNGDYVDYGDGHMPSGWDAVWKIHMHEMIDYLTDGLTIESYLETL